MKPGKQIVVTSDKFSEGYPSFRRNDFDLGLNGLDRRHSNLPDIETKVAILKKKSED